MNEKQLREKKKISIADNEGNVYVHMRLHTL